MLKPRASLIVIKSESTLTSELLINDTIKNAGLPFEYFEIPKETLRNEITQHVNQCLSQAKCDYICIIPESVKLPKNWLFNAIEYESNSAEIAFNILPYTHCLSELEIGNTLCKDFEIKPCKYSINNDNLYGILFFKKIVLYSLGALDPELELTDALWQYVQRGRFAGIVSNYHPEITATTITKPKLSETNDLKLKKLKSKEGFLQLYYQSPKQDIAIIQLEQLFSNHYPLPKIRFNHLSGQIVLLIENEIKMDSIDIIQQFAKEFHYTFKIESQYIQDDSIQKNNFIISFSEIN